MSSKTRIEQRRRLREGTRSFYAKTAACLGAVACWAYAHWRLTPSCAGRPCLRPIRPPILTPSLCVTSSNTSRPASSQHYKGCRYPFICSHQGGRGEGRRDEWLGATTCADCLFFCRHCQHRRRTRHVQLASGKHTEMEVPCGTKPSMVRSTGPPPACAEGDSVEW